jgi:hypothetical protein
MCAESATKKIKILLHNSFDQNIWDMLEKSPYQASIVRATDEQMSLDIGLIYIFIWLEFL